MTNKEKSSNHDDRRSYFRLNNSVLIEFRSATKSEVDAFLSDEKNIKAEELDVTYQIDQISRQLSTLIQSIRQESSPIAQYLDLLNKKVDYLGSMLSFEKFRNASIDGVLETTETLDISEGGMSFLSSKPLSVDCFVYCRLAIMGYRLGMETFGKVIRCTSAPEKHGHFRIGVEFPYLKELDKKNLTRFIFDKQREQLRNRSES